MGNKKEVRIISITIENFMRVKTAFIKLKRGLNQITGPNASGKTSSLRAFEAVLEGESSVPGEPIRQGEKIGEAA